MGTMSSRTRLGHASLWSARRVLFVAALVATSLPTVSLAEDDRAERFVTALEHSRAARELAAEFAGQQPSRRIASPPKNQVASELEAAVADLARLARGRDGSAAGSEELERAKKKVRALDLLEMTRFASIRAELAARGIGGEV